MTQEYKLVRALSSVQLENEVNVLLQQQHGWIPIGGVCVASPAGVTRYLQAMIRDSPSEDQTPLKGVWICPHPADEDKKDK